MKGKGLKGVFCLVLVLWLILLNDGAASGWNLFN